MSMKYGDEDIGLKGNRILIARSISRITPAPLINLYAGIIVAFSSPIGLGPILNPWTTLGICFVFMVVLPITPILYQANKGRIDLDVSEQSMRTKFFLFAIFCYTLAYIVYWIAQCDVMRLLSAAYFAVTLGIMIATLRSKVSVHSAGIGGPGTALIFVYGILAAPVLFVWAAVVWARTELKQHTFLQSTAGLVIAILITIATYIILNAI
ncbi:MAG: hypothetical protein ACXAEB_13330 [Candidatus Thorarchaeota archaeon]|jgi:membrane-associated phospholipid phosphatase